MALTFRSVTLTVTNVVPREILEEMVLFVEQKNPPLQGMLRGRAFVKKMVILTIYKDITAKGAGRLKEELGNEISITAKTLLTNVKRIRALLCLWSKSVIELGDSDEWDEIAESVDRPDLLDQINLWLDSTDFRLQRKKGRNTLSPYWSYKLNGPGWRFMVLQDGETRIRWMRGGYSPKTYDGHFLHIFRDDITRDWQGGHIICDQHFQQGEKIFQDPIFYAHYSPELPDDAGTSNTAGDKVEVLTKAQEKAKKDRVNLRARVESPFGWLKSTFASLAKPWPDTVSQLEYTVFYACGIHSERRRTKSAV